MENFKFYTNDLGYEKTETKSGSKYYVTGYISTPDIDLFNDIVTEECLDDMVIQLKTKNIKLDVEHEAYKNDTTIIPVGKIVEAHRDEKGIWVKAEVNRASSKFNEVWGSIKDKFIDAFSITFNPLEVVKQDIQGKTVRLLKKIDLLNVALTGNPVNPEATIQGAFMKSLKQLEVKPEMEEQKLVEQKDLEAVKEPIEEKAEPMKEDKEEEKEEDKEEDKKEKVEKPEAKNYDKELAEIKSATEELKKTQAELKAYLEKPQFKALLEEKPIVEKKIEWRGPLDTL